MSFADSKLNLAEGKPAYQSTTEVHEGVSHNASLATDGSTSLTKATCSKTGTFTSVKIFRRSEKSSTPTLGLHGFTEAHNCIFLKN